MKKNFNSYAYSHSPAKGVIYITIAKLYFMFAGYAIYFVLARLLGPEKFGIYGIVIGVISLINMVLITGTFQAVSKFVSEDEKYAEAVKRKTFKIQIFLGGSIFVLFFSFSGVIARLFNDPTLAFYFRISSFTILSYAIYAVFIGYLNGLREFKKQAALDMTYSTFKLLLILGLVTLGFSLTGAITGFALATFVILGIAISKVGFNPTSENFSAKKIISFEFSIMLFALIINLLMHMDLFLLKSLSSPKIANLFAGYYNAALTIARIPYLLIISITFVLFPLVSRSTFVKDVVRTKNYINSAIRYSFILLALIATLISANSKAVLSLLYTDKYLPAAFPLSILVFGVLFFALFVISTTIISGSGYPKNSIKIGLFVLFLDVVLNYILIPKYHLIGAAIASTLAMLAGVILCALYLTFKFKAFMPRASFLKIALSGLIVYLLSSSFRISGILLLIELIFFAIVYFLLLVFIKELKQSDINRLKGLLPSFRTK